MNLLLDTHAFIWWMEGSKRLSNAAKQVIGDRTNSVMISAASAWEITTKHRLGKLPGVAPIAMDLAAEVRAEGFQLLDISFRHACLAGGFKHEHRDPFDRMLIAQALLDGLVFVSNEALADDFGVQRIW